jgi:hypothetical protein
MHTQKEDNFVDTEAQAKKFLRVAEAGKTRKAPPPEEEAKVEFPITQLVYLHISSLVGRPILCS